MIQENFIGLPITLRILTSTGAVKDISAATTKQLIFKKPDGTESTKDADFVTDGTDGKINYDTESGFLTPAGVWSFQGYIITPTQTFYTTLNSFDVDSNI